MESEIESESVPESAPESQAVSETPAAALGIDLPDMGLAPEINNDVWINSDTPTAPG